MTVELNELKGMLETFRDGVVKAIDDKVKVQSDAANTEIATLKGQLSEATKAITTLQDEIAKKKSFGLPGVDGKGEQKFSWAKFYVGLAKNHKASKSLISFDEAKKFWDGEASFEQRVCKDYNAGDGTAGGFLVPPQIYQGDIIDTVYANTAIMKLPVLKFTGLSADMPIPVDGGNLTAYDLGETSPPTKTNSTFKLEWLRPKKIGAYARVSNRLLDQTNNAIEMIIRNKMAMDMAVHLANRLTNGTGSDSQGKGIMQFIASMTGVSALTANGRRLTIDDLASMKQSLAVANELRDTNTLGAILHPSALWGMLREKTEMYSAQVSRNGQPKLGSLMLDKSVIENALKAKIEDTTQISATQTSGTSSTCSTAVLGDWSKFVYASFRDPIFKVSDVASDSDGNSAFLNDDLMMVMFMEYDCNCLRPTAFTARTGVQTAEASW